MCEYLQYPPHTIIATLYIHALSFNSDQTWPFTLSSSLPSHQQPPPDTTTTSDSKGTKSQTQMRDQTWMIQIAFELQTRGPLHPSSTCLLALTEYTSSSYANSLWAEPLSSAMLTGSQQLNGGTSLASDLSSPFFSPHSHSPSTFYPYMQPPMQLMPLTHHQALYPHWRHPCTYWAFQPLPHVSYQKRQQCYRTMFQR